MTPAMTHAHGYGQGSASESTETPKTITTSTTETTPDKKEVTHGEKTEHSANELPETGEENKGLLASIASILALSGLATLFVNRKRKTNE